MRAAKDFNVGIRASFLIGDRITDIIAGKKAGCSTVLVHTGMHTAPLIETAEPIDASVQPDFECDDLPHAVEWILAQ